jgi:hypothetical protein
MRWQRTRGAAGLFDYAGHMCEHKLWQLLLLCAVDWKQQVAALTLPPATDDLRTCTDVGSGATGSSLSSLDVALSPSAMAAHIKQSR